MKFPKVEVGLAVTSVLTAIVVMTVTQALLLPTLTPAPKPKPGTACVGEPIVVEYSYAGGMMGPHECKVQCDTQKPRYILYTDNRATQCEPLPGCNDWGEDNGVECLPV